MSKEKKIAIDSRLSAFTGPIQFAVPAVSYALLYPVIIKTSDINILGLWSLLATIITSFSLLDVGFSILLTKKLSQIKSQDDINGIILGYKSSIFIYSWITIILLIIWILSHSYFLSNLNVEYSKFGLNFSVIFLLIGACLQLISKLKCAILSGLHETYLSQIVLALTPLIKLCFGLIGCFIGKPIEALSFGFMIESIIRLLILREILLKRGKTWITAAHSKIKTTDLLIGTKSMIIQGWPYYVTGVGMLLREPLFRIFVASQLGLSASGIYEIGRRVPDVLRGLVAGGTQSLFPAMGAYLSEDRHDKINTLIYTILIRLVIISGLLFGLFLICSPIFFSLWLGNYPTDLINVTYWTTLWSYFTVFNVPFWHYLNANKGEKWIALSASVHLLVLIIGMLLLRNFDLNLAQISLFWLLSSIPSQIIIYAFVGLKSDLFSNRRIYFIISIWALIVLLFWGGSKILLFSAN